MKNSYAKEYYNDFLKQLPTDYKSARWFSKPETKLDYDQTRASLLWALGDNTFDNVLEIGPGDGVWTDLLIPRVKKLTLLDQSIEMINRAKERLKDIPNISFVNEDFLKYSSQETYDLVFAIRCFEYFEDKDLAMKQFSSLLNPGGTLIIVTKNPHHASMQVVMKKELHKGQVDKKAMSELLVNGGFTKGRVLSATWRLKARYSVLRVLFRGLHLLHVQTGGFFKVPFLTDPLTESYLYVAKKP